MRENDPTDADELRLECYLSGVLPDAEVDELLVRLARSERLRSRLDEVRARNLTAADLDRASIDINPSPYVVSTSAAPLAPVLLTPTPPYHIGRLKGGRQHVMGPHDESDTFGPSSVFELEIHPDDNLIDHLPATLFLADEDGRLHRSQLTASIEDDVLVFAGKGRDAFPFSGPWTLCVLIGIDDPVIITAVTLTELRQSLPPASLLTRSVYYEAT